MEVQIRGGVLKARKSFVDEHFGIRAWDNVLAALPESDRTILKGIIIHAG